MSRATYVTPKTPRQACLNALSEIEAEQITDLERQADIILFHLRDYNGGQIFLALRRQMSLQQIVDILCDGVGSEAVEAALRERKAA